MKSTSFESIFITLIFICMILCGCGAEAAKPSPAGKSSNSGSEVASEESLETVDTVVVLEVIKDAGAIILQNAATGGRYELIFDGRTRFYDKYGQDIAAAQLQAGDIADICLSVHSGYLKSLTLSSEAFTLNKVKNYTINENKGMLTVGKDNYRLPDRLVVILNGEAVDLRDICDGDILTIRGLGRTALTAKVESGHGYISLKGEKSFIGGWAAIGGQILPISNGMLITAPEGTQELRITYKGRGGSKVVKVVRDQELKIDISDLKDKLLQTGKVKFNISPPGADLTVDGKKAEPLLPVELEYGVYRVRVTKEGYEPYDRLISVGAKNAQIDIELEDKEGSASQNRAEEKKNSSASSSVKGGIDFTLPPRITTSSASSSDQTGRDGYQAPESSSEREYSQEGTYYDEDSSSSSSSEKKAPYLFIDEPDDVEVYYDGSYKGISPIGLKKEPGTHVITLRKDGYVTRSYTINLADDEEDESFEFRELAEE